MYKIKSFFKKIYRAISWGIFIFKQPAWAADDYGYFTEGITKLLREMIIAHQNNPHFISSQAYIDKMKVIVKLLNMWKEEHFWNKYADEGIKHLGGLHEATVWKEGYSYDGWRKASEKDGRCKDLAFKILSQNIGHFWL